MSKIENWVLPECKIEGYEPVAFFYKNGTFVFYGNDDDYHDERMVYHRDGYSGYSHDDIVRQKQEDGYFGSEYDD